MTDSPSGAEAIVEHFRGLILTGMLVPGERLPSVRQLARDLGAAPGTVARAFQRLDADGLVTARRGSGTRVADLQESLPVPVLDALRRVVDEGDRHDVGVERLRAALEAMWAASH